MRLRHIAILTVVLVLLDQILKIWIKTHLCIDQAIEIFPWFQLRFVENNGAAFGMQLSTSGDIDWGKLLLTSFRVVMIGLLGFYIHYLSRKPKVDVPKGVLIGMTLIFAGAVGNLIDSLFYGMIFTQSTPLTVATLGEGYSTFMLGKVVDMFYLPLFQWNSCPDWLSFLVDYNNYFFGPIFNLADAYISVAVVYLVIFHYKFFQD
ncbi:MAG: lipoprotein signal peptidase [Alistipes sp.]|nr:lipoprotein signal peptidase [Alistipes sp.]MBQ1981322.1 lipoprotein signal peptidase [Alistipes sp.]MBQ2415340.1 lipoprotein signal peptidase [Alistipes sp.]MBQ5622775.1 lipoprotein signal peptidase [Alistipes sp.]MBQ5786041.1 lipoprotein signal peptidase [Alistipes sp.]